MSILGLMVAFAVSLVLTAAVIIFFLGLFATIGSYTDNKEPEGPPKLCCTCGMAVILITHGMCLDCVSNFIDDHLDKKEEERKKLEDSNPKPWWWELEEAIREKERNKND